MEYINEVEPERAVDILRDGGVIVCPAYTLYGFSASLWSEAANRRIYRIKGREFNSPFIVIAVREFILSMVRRDVELVELLLNAGVTVVVETRFSMPWYASRKGKTAFRLANTPFLEVVSKEFPITSTSVNVTGNEYMVEEESIIRRFGEHIDAFVRGEVLNVPSTVVEVVNNGVKVVRKGAMFDRLVDVIEKNT